MNNFQTSKTLPFDHIGDPPKIVQVGEYQIPYLSEYTAIETIELMKLDLDLKLPRQPAETDREYAARNILQLVQFAFILIRHRCKDRTFTAEDAENMPVSELMKLYALMPQPTPEQVAAASDPAKKASGA